MPIVFDSDAGTITGLSVGGLPDGIVDSGTLAANSVDSSELVDGAVDNSHLADDAVDFVTIRNDISTLALHSAIADNKAAYNLPSSFIDQFEDDTGLATQTDVDRNTTSEFIASVYAPVIPSTTQVLVTSNTTDGSTTFTDSSANNYTISNYGSVQHDTAQKKFGASSILFDGTSDDLRVPTHQLTNGNWTVDFWVRVANGALTTAYMGFLDTYSIASNSSWIMSMDNTTGKPAFYAHGSSAGWVKSNTALTEETWHHVAYVHTSGTLKIYLDGTLQDTSSTSGAAMNGTTGFTIGKNHSGTNGMNGHMDEIRVSNTALWSSNFTPPTTSENASVASATGTLISTAQTANAAQTKVSGVILYKNNEGTTTLGTDLKIYFTCNGGTNWTESTPVAAGTFSTGILMAKCPEVTCTSGTDVRYKAVWANQSLGSKETQLHGIGMNY